MNNRRPTVSFCPTDAKPVRCGGVEKSRFEPDQMRHPQHHGPTGTMSGDSQECKPCVRSSASARTFASTTLRVTSVHAMGARRSVGIGRNLKAFSKTAWSTHDQRRTNSTRMPSAGIGALTALRTSAGSITSSHFVSDARIIPVVIIGACDRAGISVNQLNQLTLEPSFRR